MAPIVPGQVSWWTRPSALVLIAANLVPIWGVLFGSWSAGSVIFLFWLENIVIGIFNIAKMLAYGALRAPGDRALLHRPLFGRLLGIAVMLVISAFFTIHYGLFCFVHGMFVLDVSGISRSGKPGALVGTVLMQISGELRYGILALFLSHGFSFVWNFLIGREYKLVTISDLFGGPYGRVLILHIAIILGGLLAIAIGESAPVLLILVAGKILLDLKLHLKEREKGAISLIWGRKAA